MSQSSRLKRAAGRSLIQFCEHFPRSKSWFKKAGLRTSKEWFGAKIVRAQWPDGKSLKLASVASNYLSFELFWRGGQYYEPVTALVLEALLQPEGLFVDVGANIGFFSLALSSRVDGLDVLAFEPNPKLHTLLCRNVAANGLGRVVCEPVALSDKPRLANLFLSASDMSASLEPAFEDHAGGTVQIRTSTLDEELARHPTSRPVTLKVDVEGHEAAFFRGAHGAMARLRPDVVAEVALHPGDEAVTMMRDLGYHFYQIADEGLLETRDPRPLVRGRLVFLNNLLSVRPPREIAALHASIKPRLDHLDLSQSSKQLDPEGIGKFLARYEASLRANSRAAGGILETAPV